MSKTSKISTGKGGDAGAAHRRPVIKKDRDQGLKITSRAKGTKACGN